jgi:hypothetical protein
VIARQDLDEEEALPEIRAVVEELAKREETEALNELAMAVRAEEIESDDTETNPSEADMEALRQVLRRPAGVSKQYDLRTEKELDAEEPTERHPLPLIANPNQGVTCPLFPNSAGITRQACTSRQSAYTWRKKRGELSPKGEKELAICGQCPEAFTVTTEAANS